MKRHIYATPLLLGLGVSLWLCGADSRAAGAGKAAARPDPEAIPVPEYQAFADKARSGKPVVVVYLGGSITVGAITAPTSGTHAGGGSYDYSTYDPEKASWRALTFAWLCSRFEITPGQFRAVNAAIGGTPSELGAYRLEQDVLSEHPDLVFVEFAVNDNGVAELTRADPESPRSILRTCRSIVGRLRAQNPNVAIFMPLSPHRMLEGSPRSAWTQLDLGLDESRLAAEMLRVPYVSMREAFYANPGNPDAGAYYGGPDTAGNYVHPAPGGHRAYAASVEAALAGVFQTGRFPFRQVVKPVIPYPVSPRLVPAEALVSNAPGWQIETPAKVEGPVLKGHPCLVSGLANAALEFRFTGSAIGLWLDHQSQGGMEIELNGKRLGCYVNNATPAGDYSGRFCSLANSLAPEALHTLRLIPVSLPAAPTPRIMLRALTVDGPSGDQARGLRDTRNRDGEDAGVGIPSPAP